MIKFGFIKKLPNNKYRVFSEKGKNMGTYDSYLGAKKRLQQIEYFKHKKANLSSLLKEAKDHEVPFTYSAIIRFLRKEFPEQVNLFMVHFKNAFDKAASEITDIQELENISLLEAVQKLDLEE